MPKFTAGKFQVDSYETPEGVPYVRMWRDTGSGWELMDSMRQEDAKALSVILDRISDALTAGQRD